MTKRVLAALVVAIAVAQPLFADFRAVARALDAEDGVSRTWIPFLGLARMFVRVASPEGVQDFQLVLFKGGENVRSMTAQRIMHEKLGAGFTPMVQVRSRRSKEWAYIYVRPLKRADRFEMVALIRDASDTVLVRVVVDADALARHINDHPRNVTRMAAR